MGTRVFLVLSDGGVEEVSLKPGEGGFARGGAFDLIRRLGPVIGAIDEGLRPGPTASRTSPPPRAKARQTAAGVGTA